MHWLVVAMWLCLAALSGPPARAAERITSFHSNVTVNAGGSLDVVETITVVAEGNHIKRGIYRDFPTRYLGGLVVVPFKVVNVQRDGQRSAWHTESRGNGVRLYIGDRGHILRHGKHTYRIHYRTDYQLRHASTEDEVYWNATGHGWAFPIESCGVTIRLPDAAPFDDPAFRDAIELNGYVGPRGSSIQRGVRAEVNAGTGTVQFSYDRRLGPREGLTVSAIWPAGYVAQRSKLGQLWRSAVFWTGVGGIATVAAYFALAWVLIGRDPPRGVVYPRFKPPFGMGPATLRYVWQMGYDPACLTAAILNIGAKGKLVIDKDDHYVLKRRGGGGSAGLTKAEKAVWRRLLQYHRVMTIDNGNHAHFSSAIDSLKRTLREEHRGHLFRINRGWLVPGALISIACSGYLLFTVALPGLFSRLQALGPSEAEPLLITTLIVAMFGLPFLAVGWRYLTTRWRTAALITVGVLGFLALGWVSRSWIVTTMVACFATMNVAFAHLLKQPTKLGRELMDMIEGFHMYLATSSRDEFVRMLPPGGPVSRRGLRRFPGRKRSDDDEPPEDSFDVFERYLPYAVALGLENQWAARFEPVLNRVTALGQADVEPSYCVSSFHRGGGWSTASLSGLSTSMSTAIAAASVAPGTTSGGSGFGGGGFSGGGGGGFSGGGGGGGGGGGW